MIRAALQVFEIEQFRVLFKNMCSMMQYIVIFSQYFLSVRLVKNVRYFLQNLSWERLC